MGARECIELGGRGRRREETASEIVAEATLTNHRSPAQQTTNGSNGTCARTRPLEAAVLFKMPGRVYADCVRVPGSPPTPDMRDSMSLGSPHSLTCHPVTQ